MPELQTTGTHAGPGGSRDPWLRYAIPPGLDRPLRVGIVTDDQTTLSAWSAQAVRMLVDSRLAALVVVAVPSARRAAPIGDGVLHHPAYRLARATIWRARALRRVKLTSLGLGEAERVRLAMSPARNGGTSVATSDVARIRDARLDVLLSFQGRDLDGDILDVARHGVWAFRHGDAPPAEAVPAAFWEVLDGSPEIAVVLRRLGTGRVADRVLRRAVVAVEPHSYRVTLNRTYDAGIDLPLQVCRDLVAVVGLDRSEHGPTAPDQRATKGGVERTVPGAVDVARVMVSTTVSNVQRLLYGAFVLKQWSIGRLDGGAARVLTGKLEGARWLRPVGRTQMLADPMIVPGTNGSIVLCEALDFADGQGVIARIEASDEAARSGWWLRAPRVRKLVDLPVHLSFPAVVATPEGLILIPEAAYSGGLLTARLDAAATSAIDFESAPGMAAVDPVAFHHGDRWWLACTELGPTADSHLWLFHGPSARGPWAAHARNPVVMEAGSARAAGLPFVHAGELYRPAQDGRLGYGRSIRVMRVLMLTPDDYAEDLVAEISPDRRSPFGLGVHTVSVDGETIWIDGYRAVLHPLAGWFRIRARRSAVPEIGRRTGGWPA